MNIILFEMAHSVTGSSSLLSLAKSTPCIEELVENPLYHSAARQNKNLL